MPVLLRPVLALTLLASVLAGALALGASRPAGAATGGAVHLVRAGETLSGIAARYSLSVATLAAANGLANPDHVLIGTRLMLSNTPAAAAPAATVDRVHTVAPGESLIRIAARYGTTAAALATTNRIADPNLVLIGARLRLPAPTGTAALPARLRDRPERLALLPVFDRWAAAYGVAPDLLKAMAWVESGWQPSVVSSTGARGVGQLMPATVDFVSDVLLRERLDPRSASDNIKLSARFLRYLLDQNANDTDRALASYYQGLRAVRERGIYPSSRHYARTVQGHRPLFR